MVKYPDRQEGGQWCTRGHLTPQVLLSPLKRAASSCPFQRQGNDLCRECDTLTTEVFAKYNRARHKRGRRGEEGGKERGGSEGGGEEEGEERRRGREEGGEGREERRGRRGGGGEEGGEEGEERREERRGRTGE